VIEKRPIVQNNVRIHKLSIDRVYKARGDEPRLLEDFTIDLQDAAPHADSMKQRESRRLSVEDGFRFSGHLHALTAEKTTDFYFLFQFGMGSFARQMAANFREDELSPMLDEALDMFVARADDLNVHYWDCSLNREVSATVDLGTEDAVELFTWLASRASLGKSWKEHRPEIPAFVRRLLEEDGRGITGSECTRKQPLH
jgi:hypothetical protein